MSYIIDADGLTPVQKRFLGAVVQAAPDGHVDSSNVEGFRLGTARAVAARGFINLTVDPATLSWVARVMTAEENMINRLRDHNGTRIRVGSIVAYRTGDHAFMVGTVRAIYADPEQGEAELELSNGDDRLSYQGWPVMADAVTVIDLPNLED
jgi:hypothetical protein